MTKIEVSRQLYRHRTKILGMSHEDAMKPPGTYSKNIDWDNLLHVAIDMIVSGITVAAAAKEIGVSYSSLQHKLSRHGMHANRIRLTGRIC